MRKTFWIVEWSYLNFGKVYLLPAGSGGAIHSVTVSASVRSASNERLGEFGATKVRRRCFFRSDYLTDTGFAMCFSIKRSSVLNFLLPTKSWNKAGCSSVGSKGFSGIRLTSFLEIVACFRYQLL